MTPAFQFPQEPRSNRVRAELAQLEPVSLRTATPTQAVIKWSTGVFHFTDDERQLYDFSSGVLVANLGHNPARWLHRFWNHLGWTGLPEPSGEMEFLPAAPLTAYNAMTPIEAVATKKLCESLQARPEGQRLTQVLWAASGSEAVQKALWACLHRDSQRDLIIATRYGFHGKKGLAGAVTGSEQDADRDPRVKFLSFPMAECDDLQQPSRTFDAAPYRAELDALWSEFGQRLNCLITEPYLGGGGSYHPPREYHQLLQSWCREHDVLLIFDEVQSNFGRTGQMYAFETYEIEPDFVCLGKGLGNGVPVAAAVGRADIMASLKYGEASDTWSANPLSCAAVLATLEEFEAQPILEYAARLSEDLRQGLCALKETGLIARVRGEGVVFGIECAPRANLSASQVAHEVVKACYLGLPEPKIGIHLLGPLAGHVLRISPPLTMTAEEAHDSLRLMHQILQNLARTL